ncbi:MAG: SBBP repeat-containing protein [Acidobacteriota bacterium]|nr:SBBP repeat-containing protein [Acidobacteriota bacterium]
MPRPFLAHKMLCDTALALALAASLDAATPRAPAGSLANVPMVFEAATGLAGKPQFRAKGRGFSLQLTGTTARFSSLNTSMAMILAGTGRRTSLDGLDQLPGVVNYFIGPDPKAWRRGLPTFAKVRLQGVYRGIDVIYHGHQRTLEYDFMLAPGADPSVIRMRFKGQGNPHVDQYGNLAFYGGANGFRHERPRAFQVIDGQTRSVSARFRVRANGEAGFLLNSYDRRYPLVIDPDIVYFAKFGGSGDEIANAVATDIEGNVYIAGQTDSTDFPVASPVQGSRAGSSTNAFVLKLNATGTALIWSTYFGGNGTTVAACISLAAQQDFFGVYVGGSTTAPDLPVTANAFQPKFRSTSSSDADGFMLRLNSSGALVYASYLGGAGRDEINAISAQPAGSFFVAGNTRSSDFPTTPGAFQRALNPGADHQDGFIAELDTVNNKLVFSTFLGGSSDDFIQGMAVDINHGIYVTGKGSPDFPTTPGAFQTKAGFLGGAFVTELNLSGTSLVYSTFLTGSFGDFASSIAIDVFGNAYVAGVASSPDFPTVAALQPALNGPSDAFVAKLDPTGSKLLMSTYLGGSFLDFATGITWSPFGLFITGFTHSLDFPTKRPRQFGFGDNDAFLVKMKNDGSAIEYSTYYSGSGNVYSNGVAVSVTAKIPPTSGDVAYIVGSTNGADLLVSPGTYGADKLIRATDLFVAAFSDALIPGSVTLDALANGASYNRGPIAPGEIVILGGSNIGPSDLVLLKLNPQGFVDTSLAGTRVLFDGVPAPLLYVGAQLIAAIVPYETVNSLAVDGIGFTNIVIERNGVSSNPVLAWVTPTAPGLLTRDASGSGQGSILNQDNTPNSAANPADRGTIVVLYGTGEGQTMPAGVNGQIATTSLPKPIDPNLKVTIDNQPAEILYAGAAPSLIAGVIQINVRVPQGIAPGPAVPVQFSTTGRVSNTVTVAVR